MTNRPARLSRRERERERERERDKKTKRKKGQLGRQTSDSIQLQIQVISRCLRDCIDFSLRDSWPWTVPAILTRKHPTLASCTNSSSSNRLYSHSQTRVTEKEKSRLRGGSHLLQWYHLLLWPVRGIGSTEFCTWHALFISNLGRDDCSVGDLLFIFSKWMQWNARCIYLAGSPWLISTKDKVQ